MKLNKEFIKKRYEDYDSRIVDFLLNIFEDVHKQNNNTSNYFLVAFDLLANQLKIYYMSIDAIDSQKKLYSEDSYKRVAKDPSIQIFNKAHSNILDILQKLSLSPFEVEKLKRLKNYDDSEDAETLLKQLVE